jgi:hypothetical protein
LTTLDEFRAAIFRYASEAEAGTKLKLKVEINSGRANAMVVWSLEETFHRRSGFAGRV